MDLQGALRHTLTSGASFLTTVPCPVPYTATLTRYFSVSELWSLTPQTHHDHSAQLIATFCVAVRKLSLSRALGEGGAHLMCFYPLRDRSLAPPFIQCLKAVASTLCSIFYGGRASLVLVNLFKQNTANKCFWVEWWHGETCVLKSNSYYNKEKQRGEYILEWCFADGIIWLWWQIELRDSALTV